jgi:hypothetical protein
MGKQKFFPAGNPKPIYGYIADYVKKEKEEKPHPVIVVCPVCGAIEAKKRWQWDGEVKESIRKEHSLRICPGCEAIKNQWVEGEITLKNRIINLVPNQIEEMMKNIEERERHNDPRNRILKIKKTKTFWKVYTTSVYLAQRIGKELEKSFVSKVTYKFLREDKHVDVVWEEK